MMNVLKHPSFFRPASRPPSPPLTTPSTSPPSSRPTSSQGLDRAPRSLNRLSLSNFRRNSPAPNTTSNGPPTTLVQDGSYLELLSLKLSEAVSRALAQPTGPAAVNEQVAGKRPIPQGRGHALGALIASELKATQDTPHLHRAILRSLHRPLSVLLTNLSAHLLPLISSPAFQHAPAPTVQSPNSNPTQVHALAIAMFVSELLETFDALDLGTDSDVRGDGLRATREGLASLINRVVGPLIAAIRNELMPHLEALETPSAGVKGMPGAKGTVSYHPSIVALQAIVPVYAKAIARYTTFTVSQPALATFLISIVWRGLVALSHRPFVASSPPPSPGLIPIALKKSRGSVTPPATPPATRFNIKLPPSRPPSPPTVAVPASAAADARALFDLFSLFPLPAGDKQATKLAREVVDDALEGLKALPPLLEAVHRLPIKIESREQFNEVARELEILTTEVPLLIALPVVLQAPLNGISPNIPVGSLIGLSEIRYKMECLPGFGRAEECSTTVALRALDTLVTHRGAHPIVSRWLEMEIAEALEH